MIFPSIQLLLGDKQYKMEEEEFVYDEVTGSKGKRRVLDALNKSKLSKHEMDDLFCDFE
jgi:hypothetical protein